MGWPGAGWVCEWQQHPKAARRFRLAAKVFQVQGPEPLTLNPKKFNPKPSPVILQQAELCSHACRLSAT